MWTHKCVSTSGPTGVWPNPKTRRFAARCAAHTAAAARAVAAWGGRAVPTLVLPSSSFLGRAKGTALLLVRRS